MCPITSLIDEMLSSQFMKFVFQHIYGQFQGKLCFVKKNYKRFVVCPWMELHSTFFRRTRRTAPLCLGTRTFIVDDFQQVCLRVGTMTDQRSTTPRRARLSLIAHKTLPKTERTQGLGAFDVCEKIQMKTNFSGTFLKNCHKLSNSL